MNIVRAFRRLAAAALLALALPACDGVEGTDSEDVTQGTARFETFKGADGTPVKTTRENIKKLHPAVANVLGMELENKLRAVNAI